MRVKKDSLKLMHKVKKKMTEESKHSSSNDIKISNLSI
jgi:hypothetical protein